MKLERLYPNPKTASYARGDGMTLALMQDGLRRAMAQGLLDAYRAARDLNHLDPDEVMAEVEKYFGAEGAWTDLLTDAFWDFENTCRTEDAANSGAHHWSEAGR